MLRALLRAGPSGWWDLAEAQAWIILAQITLRRRPVGSLVREGRAALHPTGGRSSPPEQPGPAGLARATSIARAIDRVSRLGMSRPLCLARSIALHRMMERRGLHGSEVRVGVKAGAERLEAHAWVEWGGHVLGDLPENTGSYRRFDELVVGAGKPPGKSIPASERVR